MVNLTKDEASFLYEKVKESRESCLGKKYEHLVFLKTLEDKLHGLVFPVTAEKAPNDIFIVPGSLVPYSEWETRGGGKAVVQEKRCPGSLWPIAVMYSDGVELSVAESGIWLQPDETTCWDLIKPWKEKT